MDPTGDMRAFVRVVERRSFSAAATELGLTPSAVSKLVTRLEDRLGVRLLHRTTRRLAMTTEGELYFARAQQILTDIAEAEAEVAKSRGTPYGHLRVNTSTGFGVHQLAPALPEFLLRYPEITIELSIADRLIDLVAEHVDITIRVGPITDQSLTARRIVDVRRVICASPAYLARCGMPRTSSDLANHFCIGISAQPSSRWPFRTRNGVEHVEIVPRVVTDNADAALRVALDGGGIVRLADMMVGEHIRHGRLVALFTDMHHVEALPLTALYLAGRHRMPKVGVFLDFLAQKFSTAPWRIGTDQPSRS